MKKLLLIISLFPMLVLGQTTPTITQCNNATTSPGKAIIQGSNTYTANTSINNTGTLLLNPSGNYSVTPGGNYVVNVGGLGSFTGTSFLFKSPTSFADRNTVFGLPLSSTGMFGMYNSSNINEVLIQSGITSSTYTWTLPAAQGAASTFLQNDGSGNLSWTTVASPTTTCWGLSGNSATSPGTNFIGTTDNINLLFKINSIVSGQLGTNGNTSFGIYSGSSNAATNSTFIGSGSGYTTTGANNTGIGAWTLSTTTTSVGSVAVGNYAGGRTIGSNEFFVNNQDRTTYDGDTTKSLLYGKFTSAGTTNQWLRLNGALKIVNGSQGANKVLTSDANGLGTWTTPSATNLIGILPIANGGTNQTVGTGSGLPVFQTAPVLQGQIAVIKPSGTWTWYNASANTDVARGVALQSAWAALAYGDEMIVGAGNYTVTATLSIPGKTYINLGSARLYTTDKTFKIFSAVAVNDWRIEGGILEGANNAVSPTDFGIRIDSCFNFRVTNMKISKFGNIGLNHYGSTLATTRIDGQVINCSFDSCGTGVKLQNYAEYDEFSNCTFAYNTVKAIYLDAGNGRFSNCHILNNLDGAYLGNGGNNSHGTFTGCAFNHNTGNAVYADGNTLSENFIGCDFFSTDTTSNYIKIANNGEVRILGGTMASPIKATGTLNLTSVIQGCRVPSGGNFSANMTGAQRTFVRIINIINDDGTTNSLSEGAIVDISGTSTITGITTYTNKFLTITLNPLTRILHVQLDLFGTVSGTTMSFTIPNYNISSTVNNCFGGGFQTYQSGDAPVYSITGGGFRAANSGANIVVTLYKDWSAANAWTGSGSRAAQGGFDIPIQ